MGKYNIRKATGRGAFPQNNEAQSEFKSIEISGTSFQENQFLAPDNINDKIDIFEKIVSHSYLKELDTARIVPIGNSDLSGMGWYKINRVILDKESFFPDQLSMLYTSLHDVSENVVLVVNKTGNDNIDIYIGARDFKGSNHEASSLLGTAIYGYLPGVKVEKISQDPLENIDKGGKGVASFSGIASLKDDKKETFVQGLEKFIDSTNTIPSFTAVFIAENIGQNQSYNIVKAFSSLKDALYPISEWNETFTENDTKGVSTTLTKTLGETITDSLSETVTRTEGTNESSSKGSGINWSSSSNRSPNFIQKFVVGIFGGETGTNKTVSKNEQSTDTVGKHLDYSKADQKGKSTATSNQESEAKGINSSKTTGISKQIKYSNTQAKEYIDILERHIDRVQNGVPFGLWSVATYFVTKDSSTSRKLANIYRGCVTGEESDLDTCAINSWEENQSPLLLKYIKEAQHPRFIVNNINVSPSELVSSKELAIHMSLPQSSIPGLEVREAATFGRNIKKDSSDDRSINIGYITHLGNKSTQKLYLDLEELSKHVFVSGSTGSGKSNTAYLLIDQLLEKGKNILIIEPVKGDYKKVFGGREGFNVYSTRENETLLRINPFAFPDGIHVVEHVERLIEILGVCWPMYAAMPAVLKDSVLSAYEACGWDLRLNKCKYGKLFPTIPDVVKQLNRIINSSKYSADTKGDYIGALQTRLESLTNGVYASMLSSESIPYNNLYDKNVIIDLHHIGSSETRSLLMGLIVLGLTEWRISQSENLMDQSIKHVTILEEAHNILPRVSKQQSQEGSNMIGKSVEMIASAIAEMRSYGESFIIIDQSPSAVDEAAIRNTNTKIIMNLPDGDDREVAGKALALNKEEQFDEIARLSTGEAIVWQRGWSESVMCSINEMKDRFPLKKESKFISYDQFSKPSNEFIKFFILKEKLNESEVLKLQKEILKSNIPSSEKAILIDQIEGNEDYNEENSVNAELTILGIGKEMSKLLDLYPNGDTKIITRLRDYISIDLDISNPRIQNILLSKAFTWASSQSKKWYNTCKICLQKYKN